MTLEYFHTHVDSTSTGSLCWNCTHCDHCSNAAIDRCRESRSCDHFEYDRMNRTHEPSPDTPVYVGILKDFCQGLDQAHYTLRRFSKW